MAGGKSRVEKWPTVADDRGPASREAAQTQAVPSINQNSAGIPLPNFCNLGVMLRVLILGNLLGAAAALVKASVLAEFWDQFLRAAVFLEPTLLLSLVVLCALRPWLSRLSYRAGQLVVGLGVLLISALIHRAGSSLLGPESLYGLPQSLALALLVTALLLFYLDLRARALSPTLTEARLQALQARIRPHFLFNSLNAVLSLIRANPRRAERALEDLASLFRVLMADNRELTSLEKEVELCRQYLDLEQLRLGDRLRVVWHIDKMPNDALIPPLLLQPLLENAVYHGVEPGSLSGEIVLNIYRNRDQVVLLLKNPYHGESSRHGGNKMAINNIRERLALHFDAEGSLKSQISGDTYQVTITMPYMRDTK
jgi:two-component system sensor histidine kinase AlgZ